MLYREIIAVCSEIHTIHINTVCGQNVELLNVKLVVHIVTTKCRYLSHIASFRPIETFLEERRQLIKRTATIGRKFYKSKRFYHYIH